MEYLIAILVVVIIIIIIMQLAKKDSEILNGLVSNLTEEQKRKLEDNQVENFNEKKFTWTQIGMIAEVNSKGKNKVALRVLWYNTIIQNNTLSKCQYADINMKKSDFDTKGLKNGDFVRIFIDPKNGGKIL